MQPEDMRTEKDSLGEVSLPKDALYGAQTARAIENFPISDLKLPRSFIQALALIKGAAAKVNGDLGLLTPEVAKAIMDAAEDVADGHYDAHFPLDVFQTGSGTSTNMNANEVIANLAQLRTNLKIHPNDQVNLCQSSNDVFPTAIHISAAVEVHNSLLPALHHLETVLEKRMKEFAGITKTGRTHLMDALPITLGQEFSGYLSQIQHDVARIESALPRLKALALGGTAIGTGLNAHPEFAKRVMVLLNQKTGLAFSLSHNYFQALSSQGAVVELSGHLRVLALSLSKIANDLRWMNSGPLAGLNEIQLPALQPGSSIMPGKVNPVIPEAVLMCAAQVIGNDAAITIGGLSTNFELNTMLPLIAYNILQSIKLLSNSSRILADKALAKMTVNEKTLKARLAQNPILVTALNPIIGYEKAAEIAKRAYHEERAVLEVALEMTNLSKEELEKLMDPKRLTRGGFIEKSV